MGITRKPLERLLLWRNRTTIMTQLSIFVSVLLCVSLALFVTFNYISQTSANINWQVDTMRRVLAFESKTLDNLIAELSDYSLHLRNNPNFMEMIAKTTPLTYSQSQSVESALKATFYSRKDIVEYELYLVRQNVMYTLNQANRKIKIISDIYVSELPDYATFTSKPSFSNITSCENNFIRITRTIIDSPKTTPLAVVRFVVSNAIVEEIMHRHSSEKESFCVFNRDGELFYAPEALREQDERVLLNTIINGPESARVLIDGHDSLCIINSDSENGFILVGIKSMNVVNKTSNSTRNRLILLGLALFTIVILAVVWLIHITTKPLETLALRLRGVGTGNFTERTDLVGSCDVIGLSKEVNNMTDGIQKLIDSTYVSQLNEHTARLVALESQINPHFLFNTLQAISTQAILNKQEDIYRMVSSLSAILRYSIKGSNLSTIAAELAYVDKFMTLQTARFGNRLVYVCKADDALNDLSIPKLGLMALVENSIKHGFLGEVDSMCISLSTQIIGVDAVLSVWDNGSGIVPEKLAELRETLKNPNTSTVTNIGLINLASRLSLLYNGLAKLNIESRQTPTHETTVTITIPKEVLIRVQNADD